MRKFTHKTIDIAVRYGLGSIVLYGIVAGIYFMITRGVNDFGVYM